jgi:hypothetical protein
MREKYAVDDWISSGKSLHIMRDHPHHGVPIYAGLFGLVVSDTLNLRNDIIDWLPTIHNANLNLYNKFLDTPFLNKFVYERFMEDGDMICHDSCHINFPYSKPFPTKMENHRFVGEIYDEHDNRKEQYILWVNKKELGHD